MKYKPVYAVSISGEEVGYIENKESFQEIVDNDVKVIVQKMLIL